jgi:hypothetical protein
VLALSAAAADPPDPTAIRKSAAAATNDLGVQSRLPNDSGATDPAPRRPADIGSPFGSDGFSIPAPAAVFQLVQWALIVVAAIAIITLLAIMFREPIQARLQPTFSPAGPEPPEPPSADPLALLARADQLAAAGRYAEAMHCVLLAATTILGRGRPPKTSDSLTSWELLRAATLPPPQLDALRDLVLRAERAWFGRRPAGPEDYQQVRGSFHVFASPAEGNVA